MLRLALETAGSPGSVALGLGERLLAESLLPVRAAARSGLVVPELERLLTACGRTVGEVEGVVVGSGPGSFTGVRVAAALAKGLCFARKVPLFAYSSLTVAAVGTGLPARVCAAFDARRDQLYAAAFSRLDPPEPVLRPVALSVETLLGRLGEARGWTFVGSGATLHRRALSAAGGRVLPPYLGIPRAGGLLWLAHRWPESGRVGDPASWEPEYLRSAGATPPKFGSARVRTGHAGR